MPKKTDHNNKQAVAPAVAPLRSHGNNRSHRSNLKSCLRKRIPPPRVRAAARKKVRFSLEIVLKEQLKLLSDDSNLQ